MYCSINLVDAAERPLHRASGYVAGTATVLAVVVAGYYLVLTPLLDRFDLPEPMPPWWALLLLAPAGLLGYRAWTCRATDRGQAWTQALSATALAAVINGWIGENIVFAPAILSQSGYHRRLKTAHAMGPGAAHQCGDRACRSRSRSAKPSTTTSRSIFACVQVLCVSKCCVVCCFGGTTWRGCALGQGGGRTGLTLCDFVTGHRGTAAIPRARLLSSPPATLKAPRPTGPDRWSSGNRQVHGNRTGACWDGDRVRAGRRRGWPGCPSERRLVRPCVIQVSSMHPDERRTASIAEPD